MREWRIPFAKAETGKEEADAICEVMYSTWLTQGELCAEFENRFAERFGCRNAVFVANCTSALHLAHIGLGISAGDEVICPALTFVASANAARYLGAVPRFADIQSLEEPNLSPASVESLITSKTKAIVVVHFAGFAARMSELIEIARLHDLQIIEDCAHAPGAVCRLGGEKFYTGSMGGAGCFSFFGNKNMTTGEGGMITTDDDQLAIRLRELRSHGMTTRTFERQHTGALDYDIRGLGYNYRSNEIAAAIGLRQLEKLDTFNSRRRELYKQYVERFRGCSGITIAFRNACLADAAPHIVPVYFDNAESMLAVKEALNDAGIQVSRHYELIPGFDAFGGNSDNVSRFLEVRNTLSLPLYPSLSKDAVDEVCDRVISTLSKQV